MSKPLVDVYWNLHKKVWSVKSVEEGRVILHLKRLTLTNPTFRVLDSGRERVRKEQRKNVHAFVRGWLALDKRGNFDDRVVPTTYVGRAYYNPYLTQKFVLIRPDLSVIDPEQVYLRAVELTQDRRVEVYSNYASIK